MAQQTMTGRAGVARASAGAAPEAGMRIVGALLALRQRPSSSWARRKCRELRGWAQESSSGSGVSALHPGGDVRAVPDGGLWRLPLGQGARYPAELGLAGEDERRARVTGSR